MLMHDYVFQSMSLGRFDGTKKKHTKPKSTVSTFFLHLIIIYSRMQIINPCNMGGWMGHTVPPHQYVWDVAESESRRFLLGPTTTKPLLKRILSRNSQQPCESSKSLDCLWIFARAKRWWQDVSRVSSCYSTERTHSVHCPSGSLGWGSSTLSFNKSLRPSLWSEARLSQRKLKRNF